MSKKVFALKKESLICFRCYKPRHSAERCTEDGIISCTNCFRLNVFTKKCTCKDPKKPQPLQVLRLCGPANDPELYMDLRINDQVIPALISLSIKRSRVNTSLANWLQSVSKNSIYKDVDTIIIETIRKGRLFKIPCDISDTQQDYLQSGREFLKAVGYKITIDGMTVNSDSSPILSKPCAVDYVYNDPYKGEDLREFLRKKRFFLKKGRIHLPKIHHSTESSLKLVVVKHVNH